MLSSILGLSLAHAVLLLTTKAPEYEQHAATDVWQFDHQINQVA